MNFIVWIIFGALAGWVASMLAGTNARQGWLENIIVGIVGAVTLLLAGFSALVAVVGAVILLFILRAIRRG